MYHPRVGATQEPVFEALTNEEKDAYLRLYNNYYYQRHSFYWGQQALKRLPAMMGDSRMLFCAEDLGLLPDCVEPVLDQLRILTLEIQQLPKQQGFEYSHLEANPIRSVCTISTHDMAPLRLWWQQQPERRQRYYVRRVGRPSSCRPTWQKRSLRATCIVRRCCASCNCKTGWLWTQSCARNSPSRSASIRPATAIIVGSIACI